MDNVKLLARLSPFDRLSRSEGEGEEVVEDENENGSPEDRYHILPHTLISKFVQSTISNLLMILRVGLFRVFLMQWKSFFNISVFLTDVMLVSAGPKM